MDFDTARDFVLKQAAVPTADRPDTFLGRLNQGKPPVPGQVTSLLLALKVLYEGLRHEPTLNRPLVAALLRLAYDSRQQFNEAARAGTTWPPLLDDDLDRIARAVESIVLDQWQG